MLSKKLFLIIGISVGIIAIVTPLAYDFLERVAVTNLKIQFNHIELSNIDFSNTRSFNSIQQTVTNLANPSLNSLQDIQSLGSNIPTEYQLEADLVANTKYTFNAYLDVSNPSSLPVVLDRASIKTYIEGHELSGDITIPKKITISPGGSQSVQLQGITISGKDIADIIANSPSKDFNLYFFFDITSYYSTIFGEIPIPIKIDLKAYPIPQKPDFDSFYQAVSNENSYTIGVKNNHDSPLSGTLSIGALKGNSLLGCDPACFAPIDNGLATFLRIKGGSLFDIETHQYSENISPGQSVEVNVAPTLRNNANSALILMWEPDSSPYIPYTVTVNIAGVSTTHAGNFQSPELSRIGSFLYYLVRNFGYVGEREFVSVYVPEVLTNQYNSGNSYNGESIGNQVGQIIQGVTGAIEKAIQPYVPTVQESISAYADRTTYNLGDTVTIFGTVNPVTPNQIVTLQYFNPSGASATYRQTIPNSDGSFSVAIPFRNSQLSSGTYTVTATYVGVQSQTSFYFNVIPPQTQTYTTGISISPGAGASANAYCVSTNSCFSPNPLSVPVGTTVTWTNTDSVMHVICSGTPSDEQCGKIFEEDNLRPGASYQLRFTYAGTFDYFCSVHPWMTGRVIAQ